MKKSSLVTLASVLMLMAFGCMVRAAEPIEAGIAVADITPPVPYRMSGYFHERPSTGVHDPLLAKAVVFRQGERQLALVFCDLCGIGPGLSARARQVVSERTGIPVPNIMVAATHSHTGPLYYGPLRAMYHAEAVAREGRDPLEEVDYPAQLADAIARAVVEAQAALRPVLLYAGTTQQPGLSFNRRYHMTSGPVRFNPGVNNPNIVRAAGPIDPEVGLLMLRDADDHKPLASLTVFALHLDTTGGTLYSADYPYYLSESLRGKFGKGFVSLFGIGTSGDINHVDVTTTERRKAEQIGTQLAETVKPALVDLPTIEHPRLAMAREIIEVPIQQYTADQVAQAKQTMEKAADGNVPFLELAQATKIVEIQQCQGKATMPIEVQTIRLGNDVALVALPGELFAELGLAIKAASPFRTTLVVELANDYRPIYVPTKKAFAEGSYETVYTFLQPGGGEIMVDAAVGLLHDLK